MKQYKMTLAYDGTDYAGWIQQKDQPSIVQTLHDTFVKVFNTRVEILGASKTDAGVHAIGQVARVTTEFAVDPEKLRWVWNNALPSTILIRSLEENATFHPQHNVLHKTYYYHFFVERPLPLYARYGTFIPYLLDIERFKQALQLFIGTHDFRAFYTGNDRRDTIRTLDIIECTYLATYNVYQVKIVGKKFLRHMIRRIVGAAMAVASRSSLRHADIIEALTAQKINYELPTAPAQGLLLYEITYKDTV